MEQSPIAGSQGAVDLGAMVSPTPPSSEAIPSSSGFAPGSPSVQAPLVVDVTEATFEDCMALSQTVPVVLVLFTASSLASKQAIKVVEDMARSRAGAFQVGRVDVEANPTLASALQAQSIPAGYALVARRPVPLFEGTPTEMQLGQTIDELLQVAPQLGVIGHIEVDSEELETPMPAEHEAPRAAEERGDWEGAVEAWRKVLASNPADSEAKVAMARAQFESRQEIAEPSSGPQAAADELFARGEEAQAFAVLLQAFEEQDNAEQKDAIRTRLVELFQIGSDPAAVKAARTRLATMLMI